MNVIIVHNRERLLTISAFKSALRSAREHNVRNKKINIFFTDNAKAQCKPQEIKIVMGDRSAKVGKERDYKI